MKLMIYHFSTKIDSNNAYSFKDMNYSSIIENNSKWVGFININDEDHMVFLFVKESSPVEFIGILRYPTLGSGTITRFEGRKHATTINFNETEIIRGEWEFSSFTGSYVETKKTIEGTLFHGDKTAKIELKQHHI